MKTFRAALAAALVVSGSGMAVHSAADGQVLDSLRNRTSPRQQRQRQKQEQEQEQAQEQPAQPQQPADPNARQYDLSRAEQQALQPALTAAQANDWATATAALPAAQAAARGADAKYLVGQLRLRIGIETNNTQMQAQAVDELIASGGARPDEMQRLYEHQLRFATQAGDTAKAARAQAELDRLNPNDPNHLSAPGRCPGRRQRRAGRDRAPSAGDAAETGGRRADPCRMAPARGRHRLWRSPAPDGRACSANG